MSLSTTIRGFSIEAVYLKCPPAAWKLVSDWKPWE
jgi:hypothetical protein